MCVYDIGNEVRYVSKCDKIIGMYNKNGNSLYYTYLKKGKWNLGKSGETDMLKNHEECEAVSDKYFILKKGQYFY